MGCVNPALYLTNTKGATHVPDVGRSSNPIGPRQHLLVVVPAVGVDHLVGVGDQAHPEMQKLNSVTILDMELKIVNGAGRRSSLSLRLRLPS